MMEMAESNERGRERAPERKRQRARDRDSLMGF